MRGFEALRASQECYRRTPLLRRSFMLMSAPASAADGQRDGAPAFGVLATHRVGRHTKHERLATDVAALLGDDARGEWGLRALTLIEAGVALVLILKVIVPAKILEIVQEWTPTLQCRPQTACGGGGRVVCRAARPQGSRQACCS